LLPLQTLWIPTCFLCTESSKWHLLTLLVAHLSVIDPCISVMQRSSELTQQSVKCLVVCRLSKCCCHHASRRQPPLLCNADRIVQVSLLLSCVDCAPLTSLSPHGCRTLREPVTGAFDHLRVHQISRIHAICPNLIAWPVNPATQTEPHPQVNWHTCKQS